jgi:alpha-N-arabinofuranosidase
LFDGHISPFIYGDFVEFIDDLIPGMWAERIRDRSFEGLTEPSCGYRKTKDFSKTAWREIRSLKTACGTSPEFDVALDFDPANPFVGSRSARIRVTGKSGFLAGLAQDHVSVRAGETLNLELFMRAEGLAGRVHVFVGREYGAYVDPYDEVVLDGVSKEWRRFEGVLKMPVTDADACFAIVLDGPGTLWLDKVSLMPANHRHGWRADVVKAVRALKPGMIRFGGSSLIFYDWRTGIGPRSRRVPFLNPPWNNTEENDVGIDEFLQFCKLVGAEPLLCVNSNSSSPEQIAQQVEYVNGSTKSEYGRRRADNGHPRPYHVKYWQIGNEQSGETYEKSLPRYAETMKQRDPRITLMASYPSPEIINRLSGNLDYVCPHFYTDDIERIRRETAELRERIAASPTNPRLKAGVTEWNHTAGDWGDGRAWLLTLYNGLHVARMLNHFQRNGDLIRIANRSNLVNSFCSGCIQTSPTDLYVTPAYHVQRLYSTLSGRVAVKVETSAPDLDVSGTMDADTGRFMVWMVNPQSEAVESTVALGSGAVPASARVVTVTGRDPTAVNSFERKDNVAPVEEALKPAGTQAREFPPWSLTGMEFRFGN